MCALGVPLCSPVRCATLRGAVAGVVSAAFALVRLRCDIVEALPTSSGVRVGTGAAWPRVRVPI